MFLSWSLPVVALLVPVSLLLFRRLLPRHAASALAAEGPPLRSVLVRYLAGGYVGHLAGQMSSTYLPVLVVQLLGSALGGFFLPAQTAFAATALLSQAIVASLVVEAATDEEHAPRHARAMARRIATTVWPVAAVIALGAPWLLLLFGPEYSAQATTLLRLLMLTVLFKIVTSLYNVRCRLQNRTGRIAVLQCLQAAVLLGGFAALAGSGGLVRGRLGGACGRGRSGAAARPDGPRVAPERPVSVGTRRTSRGSTASGSGSATPARPGRAGGRPALPTRTA